MAERNSTMTHAPDALVIGRPEGAGGQTIEILPGQPLGFDFDLGDVTLTHSGANIVLTFADGAEIILVPAGGATGFGETQFQFSDGAAVTESALFNRAGSADGNIEARLVDKPDAGESVAVTVQPGQPISLGFDLTAAEVLQNDNDVVILFADGAQLTLLSVLADAVSGAPPLVLLNDGSLVTGQEFLDLRGGNDTLADALNDLAPASGSGNPPPRADGNEPDVDTTPIAGPDNAPPSADVPPPAEPTPAPGAAPPSAVTAPARSGGAPAAATPEAVPAAPPALFTDGADSVDFNLLVDGGFADGTAYNALGGDDAIVLFDSADAAAAGFDTAVTFDAGAGNDTITGGRLDDLIFGGAGDDTITGGGGVESVARRLVFIGDDGGETVLRGPIYHTTAADGDIQLNSDGRAHVVSGLDADTSGLAIGFEDLPNLGDQDFNDTLIRVDFGPAIGQTIDPVAVAPAIELGDIDSTLLQGAVITIAAGFQTGDMLEAVVLEGTGIAIAARGVDPDSGLYRLALSGSATLETYAAVLAEIRLANTGDTVAAGQRDITFEVTDAGGTASMAATVSLTVLPAEVVTGSDEDDVLLGGAGNDAIDAGLGDDRLDGGGDDDILTGGGDRLDGGAGADTLRLDLSAADLENPVLLSEINQFARFLAQGADTDSTTGEGQSFTFESLGLTVRNLEQLEITVDGAPFDFAPIIEALATPAPLALDDDDPGAIAPDIALRDVDSVTLSGAVVEITLGYRDGDTLELLDAALEGGNVTVAGNAYVEDDNVYRLTLSGDATVATYEAILRAVRFGGDDGGREAGIRGIRFQVTDADGNISNAASLNFTVAEPARLVHDDEGGGSDWVAAAAGIEEDLVIDLSSDDGAGAEHAAGGRGDDILTGNSARNLLIGGAGDDTFIGSENRDILLGGSGDDTFIVEADALTANVLDKNITIGELSDRVEDAIDANDSDEPEIDETMRSGIDGGSGEDTLRIVADEDIVIDIGGGDFSRFADAIDNIEAIDLRQGAGNISLRLDLDDVIDLTDDDNELRIFRDAGDRVEISDDAVVGAAEFEGFVTFTFLDNAGTELAKVHVQDDQPVL